MKPSARRRVERQIIELTNSKGDQCSNCQTPFPHNSRSFGGVTAGGKVALVGECCQRTLKQVILSGVYLDQRYKDLDLGKGGKEQPRTPADVSKAIAAMQQTFQRIDDTANTIKAKGGWGARNARINTASSPWKDDDARWFKANPTRAHRLRPAYPGELDDVSDLQGPVPAGHELQVLLRQVEPGKRLRTAFCRNLEMSIPDVEPVIHAIFDVVSASKGGVVSHKEVAELAQRYAAAGGSADPQN